MFIAFNIPFTGNDQLMHGATSVGRLKENNKNVPYEMKR